MIAPSVFFQQPPAVFLIQQFFFELSGDPIPIEFPQVLESRFPVRLRERKCAEEVEDDGGVSASIAAGPWVAARAAGSAGEDERKDEPVSRQNATRALHWSISIAAIAAIAAVASPLTRSSVSATSCRSLGRAAAADGPI